MNHLKAAEILAAKAEIAFETPEGMEHPRPFIHKLMMDSWNESLDDPNFKITPTHDDWRQVFLNLTDLLDANLWSQIYLNSPYWTMPRYDVPKMTTWVDGLKNHWNDKSESPFTKGAKMVQGNDQWNEVLSLSKALKVFEKGFGTASFKLYPKGSTPAFSDTSGLGQLSSVICDPYIMFPPHKGQEVCFFENMTPTGYYFKEELGAEVPGYKYNFLSKSGDYEGLVRTLTIREFMSSTFKASDGRCLLIPRWGTCTILRF